MSAPSLTALRWFTQITMVSGAPLCWVFAVAALSWSHGWGALVFALAVVAGAVTWLAAVLYLRAIRGAVVAAWERVALGAAGLAALAGVAAASGIGTPADVLAAGELAGLLCAALGLRAEPTRRLPSTMLALVAVGAVAFGSATLLGALVPSVVSVLVVPPVICLVVVAQWWTYEVAKRLESARLVAGELAVAEERARFAAELHDIQGHHLQVIALKSELAARLGAGRTDEAVALMREVRQLAHDALTDTKAVVGGYRQVSLRTELANAVKVLAAAGILAETRVSAAVAGTAEQLLGLVVREATTNILRHSEASAVRLSLTASDGTARLIITNDGAARTAEPASPARMRGAAVAGSGLRALAERLERAGGSLSWSGGEGRFTVTATLENP
ncbi:sensor histidine kinase [Nonomuraea sp. NPDC059023]|uniref:sensor histidine kinase n=1 Tax=unclassified Nonomuraea TaxID=2593643 RepID=UPI0036BBB850